MSTALLPNQLSNALLQVRIAWGADLTVDPSLWTWTDVTTDVLQAGGAGVNITVGRANEASVAQPAGCSFRVKNQGGAYTPSNPVSSNYPNVRLGTPVQVRVSLNGGSVWFTRFQGEAASWTPGWDVQGKFAYVIVTAAGRTRRLGQGNKPLKSALYRAITTSSVQPSAYWPCEDGADRVTVSRAVSPIAGVSPMVATGASNFAATTGAPGSDVQPNFSAGGFLTGYVPGSGSVTSWRVQCVVQVNAITSPAFAAPIQWDTADANSWELLANTVGNGGFGYSDTLGNTFNSGAQIDDGQWHEVRATQTQSGGNIILNVFLDGTLVINQTFVGTVSRVTKVYSNIAGNVQSIMSGVGHFAVWNNAISTPGLDTMDSMRGHAGETAGARVTRLCGEEGIPLTGLVSSVTPMGPQGIDTLLNLLRECETADRGYLLDGLGPGLTFVAAAQLYNETAQVTINASSGQVPASPGPQPTNDDQRLLNRVTVTRTSGSFAVVEDTNGPLGTHAVGVFDNRYVVNTASDGQLRDIASWIVHERTVEGLRYPQVLLDLTAAPELAATWVGAIPTDRVDLTNLSSLLTQHPPGTVSLLAEGWTEFLSSRQWTVTLSCSPYRPWEVFTIQDARLGRIETDGSALSAGVSSSAASLTVFGTTGTVWDTSSAPFDVEIEGEQVTVGTVASAVTDAFGRTTSNGWGNADSGQAYTATGGSASDFSVSTGLGRHSNGTVNVQRFTTLDTLATDLLIYIDTTAVVNSATGAPVQQSLMARMSNTSNFYSARIDITTGAAVTLTIVKVVAGAPTTLAGPVTIDTGHLSADSYRVGFWVQGSTLQAKAWFLPGTEPTNWSLTTTDTSLTTGTLAGVMSTLATGNTNTSPVATTYDNLAVNNPQTLTVTRSVNGIVKAHNSGATVKLWRPGVLAL